MLSRTQNNLNFCLAFLLGFCLAFLSDLLRVSSQGFAWPFSQTYSGFPLRVSSQGFLSGFLFIIN